MAKKVGQGVSILILNCGTSSIKMSLFSVDSHNALKRVWEAHGKELFSLSSFLELGIKKKTRISLASCKTYRDVILVMLQQLQKDPWLLSSIHLVGHRVVHGGDLFTKSTLLTGDIVQKLRLLSSLAPLHNPPSLEGIAVIQDALPKSIPQVAVFDTAFHAYLAPHVSLYPIPLALSKKYKIKKYGFHGISHGYLWKKYAEAYPHLAKTSKIITLHLGNGCSLTAIRAGQSIDTTMGFTPLEGLMMSTRSGSIDPAIVAFLSEKEGITSSEVIALLNRDSGLLGVSGKTGSMQKLLPLVGKEARAELAVDMFVHHLIKEAGAFLALLGGIEAFLFSGGIGEHAAIIRSRFLKHFSWLDLIVSEAKNKACTDLANGEMRRITTPSSSIQAFVIATDENEAIAREMTQERFY